MKTMEPTEAGSLLAVILKERQRFLAITVRLVGDREAARDVFQVALLKALERGTTIRDPQRTLSWFSRVLTNTAVDYVRHGDAYRRALERLVAGGHVEQTALDARPEAVCRCPFDVLPTLKPAYAAILRRVDLEGRSLGEVAQEARVTTNNARVRLHRARRTLRSQLMETCGGPPLQRCAPCTCRHGGRRDRVAARTRRPRVGGKEV